MMRRKEIANDKGEESGLPLLDIYEAEDAQEITRQDNLKEFYVITMFMFRHLWSSLAVGRTPNQN